MPPAKRRLRVAQVAPLFESVPPRWYGGTERVVSYLTEELVRQGHQVTLFASGDSRTEARLVSVWDRALRLDDRRPAADPLHALQIAAVMKRAREFDVIHFHTDSVHLPALRCCPVPAVTTLHGRLDRPELERAYREFSELPMVSISHAQRAPLPWLNWMATVHHGLPLGLHAVRAAPGRYLAFLGRVSPEKGVDRAIEIARRASVPLKIAAKIDSVDQDYFDQRIRPLLAAPGVEFLGEIDEPNKSVLLGGAMALLFPIDWPEPFGLAMIEAMACGTPVIAFRGGSVAEVVDSGQTGFVVSSVEQATACVSRVSELDRRNCRRVFERRFSAARMARDYCEVYAHCLERRCQLTA